jgi:Pyruvate/2-oxoacid:ferredoxin oxidoreductase delta subunit
MMQVGNFMHYVSRFLGGFIIGFVRIWQISLVTLSIVPLIALAGGIYAYITIGLIAKVRKSYVKAGQIAEEVSLIILNVDKTDLKLSHCTKCWFCFIMCESNATDKIQNHSLLIIYDIDSGDRKC